MDKRKIAALIMLEVFDQEAPIIVNWTQKERWIDAIIKGFEEIEKTETPGAATPRESM